MMRFPHGQSVIVHRPTLSTDPFSGEQEKSWVGATATLFERVAVWPRTSADLPEAPRPDLVVTGIAASLPYGAAVDESDRVEVLGGPYVGMWEVDGIPAHRSSPFSGWSPGCVVNLIRAEG